MPGSTPLADLIATPATDSLPRSTSEMTFGAALAWTDLAARTERSETFIRVAAWDWETEVPANLPTPDLCWLPWKSPRFLSAILAAMLARCLSVRCRRCGFIATT